MILEFRPSIRRAENSQVRKHLLESPGNIVSAMHSRRRCELGLFMHAKHPREMKLHPDLLPLIGADWFLRSLGIAIANNVMHDKFSSTCQRSARRHHESREAQGDWRVLALNRAASWSRIRTPSSHLIEIDA